MANPFVHVELHTKDLPKAKSFYKDLFGWELEDLSMQGFTYTLIKPGDGTGGGMMTNPDANVPPHWLAYVGVADVAASTAKARSLGATVLQDVTAVGDFGKMSIIQDPTRAVLAMWQAIGKD